MITTPCSSTLNRGEQLRSMSGASEALVNTARKKGGCSYEVFKGLYN